MTKRKKDGPDPIDCHVGARIKARRTGLGISQAELGKALDVTFQQVQKYENGANRVGSSNLFRIATLLGVGVDYFFEGLSTDHARLSNGGGLKDQPQATFAQDPLSSREAVKLVHAYFQIAEPDIRQQVFKLIKTLSED